ncbi:MAG: fatty acid--CoA ligase family protein, partial [Pseudomonadota bacterium]
WSVGATAVNPREGTDPQTLPLMLNRHDITIFASVPGIYRKILKQSTAQILPKLRHGLSAGEALSVDLRETWEAATGTAIHEALGMSECSTYLSSAPGRPAPRGSTGYVQSGRAVAVLDLGPGGVGELAIREDEMGLMLGYLDEAGQPHLRLDDGWFRTGDLVRQAEDGAIATAGRRDDLITAGGFRIAPQEIEAAFEGLGSCAAFSAPLTSGAFVVALAVEGAFSEDDARARAEACLAAYKRPRIYIPCAALPRNPNGKLNRRALTELWPELSKAHK